MSPLMLMVFVPVIILGIALFALFMGAATAGALEAVEERPERDPSDVVHRATPFGQPEKPRAKAA